MSERCQGSVSCDPQDLHEALPIHTRKITDSCRDKDCIEDLRVYLTNSSQAVLDSGVGAKVRCAELLYTYIDVEPVAFDRNHYCIDVTFYYQILADTMAGNTRPTTLYGLAVFSKRAVLCGEDSRAHIFTSDTRLGAPDGISRYRANRPTAVVEVLDPMVLASKVRQACDCGCREVSPVQIPEEILQLFDEQLVLSGEANRLYVTLGQFSIIRLERDAQLVVPVLDYSIPTKECCDAPGCAEDPCEMFSRIPFPEGQFAPAGCDRSCDQSCGYTTTGNC
ncbi:MAG: hypothetical protein IJO45_01735 [Oscillospiraceae bacterium]|nr:hypothetical protein [Oscillospiraceae bacterium]